MQGVKRPGTARAVGWNEMVAVPREQGAVGRLERARALFL